MDNDITQALRTLQEGKLILYPTDTVWGIGCDATHAEAVARIYQLKKRDDSKSMIILAADQRDILKYAAAPHPAVFDLLDSSTRPTTVIYEQALGLADNLINEDGSIAIRIVQDPFCKKLIKRLGKPIVSTSANISGEKTPTFFPEVSDTVKTGVDYIVRYRQEDRQKAQPSRIIKLLTSGEIQVIRD